MQLDAASFEQRYATGISTHDVLRMSVSKDAEIVLTNTPQTKYAVMVSIPK